MPPQLLVVAVLEAAEALVLRAYVAQDLRGLPGPRVVAPDGGDQVQAVDSHLLHLVAFADRELMRQVDEPGVRLDQVRVDRRDGPADHRRDATRSPVGMLDQVGIRHHVIG